jgi:phosphoribosyl 1,2-cyclic phosphate phosphodiesterase
MEGAPSPRHPELTLKLTFLGTGTSFGIPVIGCRCPTCTSEDPRDRRTRHGALITLGEKHLLIDAPPELRLQLVKTGVRHVDAVWFTHVHADHVHGADDLRIFRFRSKEDLPVFCPEGSRWELLRRFPYIFDEEIQAPPGSTIPQFILTGFSAFEEVEVFGHRFQALPVPHGPTTVFGFRVGELGYITDGKALPPDTLEALKGVRILVLNALWWGNPHPTHFNVEEAMAAAEAVGAEKTYLTHMTHEVRHQELLDRLPSWVEPAYDGLSIEFSGT